VELILAQGDLDIRFDSILFDGIESAVASVFANGEFSFSLAEGVVMRNEEVISESALLMVWLQKASPSSVDTAKELAKSFEEGLYDVFDAGRVVQVVSMLSVLYHEGWSIKELR